MGARAHHHAGRATAMTGHHPWGELTKHFTPKDRKIVEAGAAEIVVDSDRRECRQQRSARPADGSQHDGACAPPTQAPVHLHPDW